MRWGQIDPKHNRRVKLIFESLARLCCCCAVVLIGQGRFANFGQLARARLQLWKLREGSGVLGSPVIELKALSGDTY